VTGRRLRRIRSSYRAAGTAFYGLANRRYLEPRTYSSRGDEPVNPPAGPNLVQGSQPRYALTGHLVYGHSGTLMAVPFDERRLALTGASGPVIGGVLQFNSSGAAQYSFSSTGTLVYVAGGLVIGQSRLVWLNRKGVEKPIPAAPHNYLFPRVSPDGRRIAVEIIEEEEQVWPTMHRGVDHARRARRIDCFGVSSHVL